MYPFGDGKYRFNLVLANKGEAFLDEEPAHTAVRCEREVEAEWSKARNAADRRRCSLVNHRYRRVTKGERGEDIENCRFERTFDPAF